MSAKGITLVAVALLALPCSSVARDGVALPTVAFFYGRSLPVAELGHFDWVVVEPDHVDARELAALQRSGTRVFAYLSLGEAPAGSVEPSWIIGQNAGWSSAIMNPAAAGWRARVEARATALGERGFQGLFLDTLDSYMAALPDPQRQKAAGASLASLVRAIHTAAPGLALFFNRGFELLDEVGPLASGLAAESLFTGWDARSGRYVEVAAPDRAWLSDRLREVREKLGIPVVAVDYLPPARREDMRAVARRIAALGFVPWVASAALDTLGVGAVEVVPRRVLLLYDGAAFPAVEKSPAHRLAALPLEHLGLVPEYLDVRTGLPGGTLAGRYAGVVSWFTGGDLPPEVGYPAWLLRQVEDGVRVAALGRLGFTPGPKVLGRLGLEEVTDRAGHAVRLSRRDGMVGFEAEPELRSRGLTRLKAASRDVDVHLGVEDAAGRRVDAVLTAPWGGLALDPYLVEVGYQGRVRWIVDPFAFLTRALGVAGLPAPDVTTESGALILLVSTAGDDLETASGDAAVSAEALRSGLLEPEPMATTLLLRQPKARAEALSLSSLPFLELAELRSSVPHGTNPAGAATPKPALMIAAWELQGGPPALASVPPLQAPGGRGLHLPGLDEAGAAELAWRGVLDQPHLAALARLRDGGARRLQPLGLHYPPSIAGAPGATRSLREALHWAAGQRTLPLWLSEYAARVDGFSSATLARSLDGTFTFRGLGALRTVRLSGTLGWPDLARSRGVAGFVTRGDVVYVSLAGLDRASLAIAGSPPARPHLAWSNAVVEQWEEREDEITLRLRGHAPVRLEIAGAERACTLTVGGELLAPAWNAGRQAFSISEPDTGVASLRCPHD